LQVANRLPIGKTKAPARAWPWEANPERFPGPGCAAVNIASVTGQGQRFEARRGDRAYRTTNKNSLENVGMECTCWLVRYTVKSLRRVEVTRFVLFTTSSERSGRSIRLDWKLASSDLIPACMLTQYAMASCLRSASSFDFSWY
jgi:hypothetical protein